MRWPKWPVSGRVVGREQRERERAWQAAERNAAFPGRRSLPLVEVVRSMIGHVRRRDESPPLRMGGQYRPLNRQREETRRGSKD